MKRILFVLSLVLLTGFSDFCQAQYRSYGDEPRKKFVIGTRPISDILLQPNIKLEFAFIDQASVGLQFTQHTILYAGPKIELFGRYYPKRAESMSAPEGFFFQVKGIAGKHDKMLDDLRDQLIDDALGEIGRDDLRGFIDEIDNLATEGGQEVSNILEDNGFQDFLENNGLADELDDLGNIIDDILGTGGGNDGDVHSTEDISQVEGVLNDVEGFLDGERGEPKFTATGFSVGGGRQWLFGANKNIAFEVYGGFRYYASTSFNFFDIAENKAFQLTRGLPVELGIQIGFAF